MDDVIFQLADYQKQNMPFVLCMVTEAIGSTPRSSGSRMLVFADGSIKGTIGGGSVELQIRKEAAEVLRTGNSSVFRYQLEKDLKMQCGGQMSVYLEPFFPSSPLFIFGAGHVGREVGAMALSLGFMVHYIDHRPEIFKEFDPQSAQCHVGSYTGLIPELPLNAQSYAVIMTPDHCNDEAVLAELGKIQLKYLGMMGSKRKVAEISKRLLSSNTLTQAQLDFVDMPVGIAIQAETPREIAVSIVAKLIAVKNAKN